ncbi:nickel-cobalt-cadmium resistance protein [Natrinema mahii]|nr:nickel-cobalt-cadmium resistance protein [Natrinema mahii]
MSAPIFSEEPYLYVFVGALAVWIVSDLRIGARHRDGATGPRDRGSKRVIGIAVSGGTAGAALLPELVAVPTLPRQRVAFWIGIGLVVLGVLFRQYAVRTLGEYFSLAVSVDEADTVVTSGPYRWVRHPSYTGGLTTMVGIGVATGNWLSLGVVTLAGVAGYGYRIHVEERVLREKLGESYEAYAERTQYRLVPGLW